MQESFGQAESVEKPPMWMRFFESGKYGIGGSVEGPFVFWVRLIRNIFDMQSRLKSVWHIMWSDPISGPISDQRKLDQNQTNTIQFQCIISGYFGPLNSHKRELNLFRQPQKFRFNFKQISRPHQRGHQCWKRGPHTKASPNCGSSARQRFRAEWFQLTKKTNSPDNLPNAFRQKRNSRRRRKKNQGAKKIMQKEKSQDGDVFRRVFHDYHSHSPESIHNRTVRESQSRASQQELCTFWLSIKIKWVRVAVCPGVMHTAKERRKNEKCQRTWTYKSKWVEINAPAQKYIQRII